MKEGWTYKKLGEICKLYQPHTISSKEMVEDGKYNVFGANGIIGKYNKYNHEEPEILMTCRGATCGNINVSTPKSWINGNAMVVHIEDERTINKSFLIYILSHIDKAHIITGAAQPQITRQTLSPLIICYPELTEQQRIVEYLDAAFAQIDELKANAEKQLAEARALFQAALTQAMQPKPDWQSCSLKDICQIKSVLIDPTEGTYRHLIHVGGANIVSGSGSLIDLKTATEEGVTSGKFTFDENDVLYNKIRPYLIKVARPGFKGICSADMYPITPKEKLIKDYLYYILISPEFTKYAILNSNRAGMPKINRDALFSYSCSIPSIEEQQHISNYLDSLSSHDRELEEISRKTAAECDALKQALLRQVFE